MIDLANQGAGFLDTCSGLLQRMIEVVPSNVKLSEVITPMQVKPINATLDFDASGDLIFKGYIRVISISDPASRLGLISQQILTSASSSAPSVLTLTTSSNPNPIVLTPEADTGASVFGTTQFFPFSTPIASPSSFCTLTINGNNLAPHTFAVQTDAFIVPSLSSLSSGSSTKVNFVVAVLPSKGYFKKRSSPPTVSVSAPVPQMGTLGPAILSFGDVAVTSVGTKAGYELWSGSVDFGVLATGNVTVEVVSGGVTIDTLLLG